jgi:hypothetical protein
MRPTCRSCGKRWNWSPGRADGSNGGSVIWSGPATPLARMIMGVTEDPALLVSHVNGDRLDELSRSDAIGIAAGGEAPEEVGRA